MDEIWSSNDSWINVVHVASRKAMSWFPASTRVKDIRPFKEKNSKYLPYLFETQPWQESTVKVLCNAWLQDFIRERLWREWLEWRCLAIAYLENPFTLQMQWNRQDRLAVLKLFYVIYLLLIIFKWKHLCPLKYYLFRNGVLFKSEHQE